MPMLLKEPIPLCACAECLSRQPERSSVKSHNRKLMLRMLVETKAERALRYQERREAREVAE